MRSVLWTGTRSRRRGGSWRSSVKAPACSTRRRPCGRRLDAAGFTYLAEDAAWDIEPGGRYYTCRNASSVVAWAVGSRPTGGASRYHFQVAAAHGDSPHVQAQEQRASGGARGRSTPERRALRGHDRLHVVRPPAHARGPRPRTGRGAAWRAGSWRLTARSRSSRASPCTSTAASTGGFAPNRARRPLPGHRGVAPSRRRHRGARRP